MKDKDAHLMMEAYREGNTYAEELGDPIALRQEVEEYLTKYDTRRIDPAVNKMNILAIIDRYLGHISRPPDKP